MGKELERIKFRMDRIAKKGGGPKTNAEIEAWEQSIKQPENPDIRKFKEEISVTCTPEQTYFSFMPYDVTRTSPFFPMSKQEMKKREPTMLEWVNNWGKIKIEGKRLSVYDESVLLAVLAIVKRDQAETIYTTMSELCKIMGITGGDNYASIRESLERLVGTQITLQKKQNKNFKTVMSNTIISGFTEDKQLEITVNSYFLQMYIDSFVSFINLHFRSTIRMDIAKALYRFYNGQTGDKYACHILTLARAVNLDPNLPVFKIRDRLKKGVKELKQKGYLSRSILNKHDVLTVWKKQKTKRVS